MRSSFSIHINCNRFIKCLPVCFAHSGFYLYSPLFLLSELTQVPRGQRWSRVGGGLRGVCVDYGAVSLVVDQVGHEEALLVLSFTAGGAEAGLYVVGVTARGVTADRSLVSPMGARLEGRHAREDVSITVTQCETGAHHI